MTKIYIAARLSKRDTANKLAQYLISFGFEITSRWLKLECGHLTHSEFSAQATNSEFQKFASDDIEDVKACDWVISITEEPRGNGRGGRHVEFGYALGLGKQLTIIGPQEHAFHHLKDVDHFTSLDLFLLDLEYLESKVMVEKNYFQPTLYDWSRFRKV